MVLIPLGAFAWAIGVVYLIIPIAAAVLISDRGPVRYFQYTRVQRFICWYLALYSYLSLLSDRFPTEKPERIVTFEVTPAGSPTVGSALLRLVTSFPSGLVLAALGLVGLVIWLMATVCVLVQEDYPQPLYDFQLGIMRWHARLLGYHASLVEEYPPFAIDNGPEEALPAAEPLPDQA
jgi:hypothetical protein